MEFTKAYFIYEWNQYQLQCHQGTSSEQGKKTNCNKVFSKHSIRIEPRDRIAKIEFIRFYHRIPIVHFSILYRRYLFSGWLTIQL